MSCGLAWVQSLVDSYIHSCPPSSYRSSHSHHSLYCTHRYLKMRKLQLKPTIPFTLKHLSRTHFPEQHQSRIYAWYSHTPWTFKCLQIQELGWMSGKSGMERGDTCLHIQIPLQFFFYMQKYHCWVIRVSWRQQCFCKDQGKKLSTRQN